jgi:hypothetical protein
MISVQKQLEKFHERSCFGISEHYVRPDNVHYR